MSNQPALSVENLKVAFATDRGIVNAVSGVNLEVKPGEILAVVGESGSGKSVTARTAMGLLPETATTSGAVIVNGHDILKLDAEQLRAARGRDMAMVFQEPSTALNPVYTVGWQIMEGLRAHTPKGQKFDQKAARAKAIEILGRVGLPEPEQRVDYYPHQLSGGQKQRVVIAAALVLGPALIIADEPTTALDVTVQAEILDLLRESRDLTGAAIMLISHNMGVVANLADRVAVMYQGKLVEQAPVDELFANPHHPYTKKLLAAVPKINSKSAKASVVAKGEPTVVAKGLEVVYPGSLGRSGFRAVDGVSFEINQGEVVGLVGESGSGKTTIGRSLVGLVKATGGELSVLGTNVVGAKPAVFHRMADQIGFVFQDPATSFNPLATIGEAIAEPILVHGVASTYEQAKPTVQDLLESVQLPREFADRFPHELSGGQRQRASFARALALKPKLVIADEPTSALDVSVQATVLQLFAKLQREYGFACLFITHDLAVVNQVASRLLVMHRGKLVEQGPTIDVLTKPAEDYTKKLVASSPVADPAVERAKRKNSKQS